MRAGRRNKKVQIRGFTQVDNDFGEKEETYFTVATVWASINPITGRETWIAEKLSAEVDTKIEIKFRHDVRSDYKIKHGKSLYTIDSIINPGMKNIDLVLACTKAKDQDLNG